MTLTPELTAPGPCPISPCDWDLEGPLEDHLYGEHETEDLAATLVRITLDNDRLRAQLAGVWPCTCSHLPDRHRYDSAIGRNYCHDCRPDADLHNYEPAPAKTED